MGRFLTPPPAVIDALVTEADLPRIEAAFRDGEWDWVGRPRSFKETSSALWQVGRSSWWRSRFSWVQVVPVHGDVVHAKGDSQNRWQVSLHDGVSLIRLSRLLSIVARGSQVWDAAGFSEWQWVTHHMLGAVVADKLVDQVVMVASGNYRGERPVPELRRVLLRELDATDPA